MTSRTAPVRGTAAALLAAAALLLAGCDAGPASAPRAQAPAADPNAAFLAEVAARCATATATATASPTAAAAGGGSGPTDPESRKYAENHAYRQQTELSPAARCRGEAHAARIRTELAAAHAADPAALTALLRRLGYPVDAGDVYEGSAGQGPGFALMLPGTGPCVSGRAADPTRVEAHGVYVEGGCKEPAGGH
ncbi:hypothetical protein EF912_35530 [Streptomyces sp. WAC07061]|uniref:hypothetical protein n=1 Tax=Streptomyces sp. WAC07061 TaxID=2487410 RepID=UPI000F7B49DE|nr:hypothetical protein [Streptomyces sp. WAC07061]RSS36392.1 hypothetical protein EF912_35530 [Streptomyces sp. WAC07061]